VRCRRGDDQLVESGVERGQLAELAGRAVAEARVDGDHRGREPVHLVQRRRLDPGRGAAGGQAFQHGPQLVGLLEILGRPGPDPGAAVGQHLDESL